MPMRFIYDSDADPNHGETLQQLERDLDALAKTEEREAAANDWAPGRRLQRIQALLGKYPHLKIEVDGVTIPRP